MVLQILILRSQTYSKPMKPYPPKARGSSRRAGQDGILWVSINVSVQPASSNTSGEMSCMSARSVSGHLWSKLDLRAVVHVYFAGMASSGARKAFPRRLRNER